MVYYNSSVGMTVVSWVSILLVVFMGALSFWYSRPQRDDPDAPPTDWLG